MVRWNSKTWKKRGYLVAVMTSIADSLIAPMASSWIQNVASSFMNAIAGKEVMRAAKQQESDFFPSLELTLMTDGRGRELAEQEYDVKWSYWQKCLVLCHAFSNIEITNYFNFEPKLN